MGFLDRALRDQFEESKPEALQADVRLISGCEDRQTSADVSSVGDFQLPDPAGRAGGACTSALLNILYQDDQTPEVALSFTEVLDKMRDDLSSRGFEQIPQLSASQPIDVSVDFDLVPPEATGTRRAVMVGINYVGAEQGELSGCHNDALNMVRYLEQVHGFDSSNINILLDDGEHENPTKDNILAAFKAMVESAESGDALFIHYSGHGTKVQDSSGDEADRNDEAIVPVDYNDAGLIMDDELYEILIKPLPKDAHLVCLFDCCHSGTVLDLPYVFKADGEFQQMEIVENFDFSKLLGKLNVPDDVKQNLLGVVQSKIPQGVVPDNLREGLIGALGKW